MDKTVPAGAAVLLRFIAQTEVARTAPECYNMIYGHNQGKLSKPLTHMTLAEVQAAQSDWSKRFGSSASGAYQFMRATLAELIKELKLDTSMKFDGDLQDRLGYHLLKRRGYADFVSGKMSVNEFGRRLAMEWASFPVLAPTKGAKRTVLRGQSFYAGDGLNKSLVKPEVVEQLLLDILRPKAAPEPAQLELPEVPTHIVVDAVEPIKEAIDDVESLKTPSSTALRLGLFATLVAAATSLVAAYDWLVALPCNAVGILCGN